HGFEVEIVNDLSYLFLANRTGDLIHLVSDEGRFIGNFFRRDHPVYTSFTSRLKVEAKIRYGFFAQKTVVFMVLTLCDLAFDVYMNWNYALLQILSYMAVA